MAGRVTSSEKGDVIGSNPISWVCSAISSMVERDYTLLGFFLDCFLFRMCGVTVVAVTSYDKYYFGDIVVLSFLPQLVFPPFLIFYQ